MLYALLWPAREDVENQTTALGAGPVELVDAFRVVSLLVNAPGVELVGLGCFQF